MNFSEEITGPVSFCVSSGKGGVGKTTLAVNLALCLADRGQQVLLVDGDLGLSNVDVLLGTTVRRNIRDALENEDLRSDLLVRPYENLAVLPAASGVPELVDFTKRRQDLFFRMVSDLASGFDCLIFDTGAGIGSTVLWLNTLAAHNIVVFKNDPAAITDGYALIKVLSIKMKKKRFQVVFNRVDSPAQAMEAFEKLSLVTGRFLDATLVFLGALPEDDAVKDSIRSQSPLIRQAPDSPAAGAIYEMAGRLRALGDGQE